MAVVDRPVSDVDPFSIESIRDPFSCDGLLREQAPAVWLSTYDIWAIGRHEHVYDVVKDWKTFSSTSRPFHDPESVRPEILVTDDPPRHTRARLPIQKALLSLRRLRPEFERAAEELVDELLAGGSADIDGHGDIAAAYIVRVFPDAVGVPQEGREHLLPFGDVAFNTFGPPESEIMADALVRCVGAIDWVDRVCKRDALDPSGIGERIYAAADAGDVTVDEAELLVQTLLAAGADTTVFAIGSLLKAFAEFPDQWRLVRDDPSLAEKAFDEILRYECPARIGGRITTRDVELDGVRIPAGSRLQLLWLAAGRDPRRWDDPDRFDVTRDTSGHVGFGHGIHVCVGRALARMEGECLLAALARRVERIELTGEPQVAVNMAAHGYDRLPLRLHV